MSEVDVRKDMESKNFATNLLKGEVPEIPTPGSSKNYDNEKSVPAITLKRLKSMERFFTIVETHAATTDTDSSYIIIKPVVQSLKYVKKFVESLNLFKHLTCTYEIKEDKDSKYIQVKISGLVWYNERDQSDVKRFVRWWSSLPEEISVSLPTNSENSNVNGKYAPPIVSG